MYFYLAIIVMVFLIYVYNIKTIVIPEKSMTKGKILLIILLFIMGLIIYLNTKNRKLAVLFGIILIFIILFKFGFTKDGLSVFGRQFIKKEDMDFIKIDYRKKDIELKINHIKYGDSVTRISFDKKYEEDILNWIEVNKIDYISP